MKYKYEDFTGDVHSTFISLFASQYGLGDENGEYDISININGNDVNFIKFVEMLSAKLKLAIKCGAAQLLVEKVNTEWLRDIENKLYDVRKSFTDKTIEEIARNLGLDESRVRSIFEDN